MFSNTKGTVTIHAATLFVTQSIRYLSPSAGSHLHAGTTVPVRLQLADRHAVALSDTSAKAVPTRVELTTGTGTVRATSSCTYSASANTFSCSLKVPSGLASGTYYLVGQTKLSGGPWVTARPAGSAKNPEPVVLG